MSKPLVVACGALVPELRAVLAANGMTDLVDVRYLPANLHNRPDRIVDAVDEAVRELDADGERQVLLGYGDCGTGGGIDRYVADHPGTSRLAGDHCYEFFTGSDEFAELQAEELGTFFLTDFLAKHFDALVWQAYRLDTHPELLDMLFGNYTRVVLLSQSDDPEVVTIAADAAARLRLRFEHRHVGLHPFEGAVTTALPLPAIRKAG